MKKLKTYVITVSRNFPATHPRKGEETDFVDSITLNMTFGGNGKIHTIRANYPLWEKRMKEVQDGKAIISLRYWSGKPYNSKQIEFAQLDKDSGCGVQEILFSYKENQNPLGDVGIRTNGNILYHSYDIKDVAPNDGLSVEDFKAWFNGYDLSKPMAIIHFTKFRY